MNAALTLLLAQLIDAREEAGITQRQLAAKMHAGYASVKAWEEGYNAPGAERFVLWADTLGYDVVLRPRKGKDAPVRGKRWTIRWRPGSPKEAS